MERLTVADELMENGKRRCHIIDGRAVREQAMKFYWRLKKYEDLDLSPEQIEAMQQHNHILIEELAEYEQLKKQGLLLKLPCKVGDTIYLLDYEERKFDEATVEEIMIDSEGLFINTDYANYLHTKLEYVFLTKAEAEKALEEMEK